MPNDRNSIGPDINYEKKILQVKRKFERAGVPFNRICVANEKVIAVDVDEEDIPDARSVAVEITFDDGPMVLVRCVMFDCEMEQ